MFILFLMEYGVYNTSWICYNLFSYFPVYLDSIFQVSPLIKNDAKKHNQIQGSLNISTLYFFVIGFQKGHHGVKMINEKFWNAFENLLIVSDVCQKDCISSHLHLQ